MKTFVAKYQHILAALALVMTTFASNRACALILYEPQRPKAAKSLCKF